MKSARFLSPLVVSAALIAAACSGGGDSDTGTSVPEAVESAPTATDEATDVAVTNPPVETTTTVAATTTIAAPTTTIAPAPLEGPLRVVQLLAADGLAGRNNLTNGSATTRGLLIPMLREFVEPFRPELEGDSGYLLQYEEGVNLLGVMPGRGDLAEDYVVIGAHYDHLGIGPGVCDALDTADDVICNGAADNAAGVAMALAVAESIRDADVAALLDAGDEGRRSVIVALWDGGEDGLAGSQFFVDNPPFRLADMVAYVNFDIQGASLLPSLAASSMVVGSETGGLLLAVATQDAIDQSALDYAHVSLVFGEGRSDNVEFARVGVPTVSLTDAPNGCNHTVLDDLAHLDGDKLLLQIETASTLVVDLATRDARPQFLENAPVTRYSDAEEWLELVERAEPDFGLLGSESAADAAQLLEDLGSIVDDGVGSYGGGDEDTLLDGAAALLNALASTECIIPA